MWLEVISSVSNEQPTCLAPAAMVAASNSLRHSASFSCLTKTIAQCPDKSYRARTATLSTADLDYGFVIKPCEGPPAPVIHAHRQPLKSQDLESLVKTERSNLLKKVLVKKSVSLLNPNQWWSPKFRRVKSSKNKDKTLQEIQTQKRWRSLGALLKVTSANSSRSSNMSQSSLPAQSFYLLDDFLKPSSVNREPKGEEKSVRYRKNSSSSSLDLPYTGAVTASKPSGSPPKSCYECYVCKQFLENCCEENGPSNHKFCCRQNKIVKSGKVNGVPLSQKMKDKHQNFDVPTIISADVYETHSLESCPSNDCPKEARKEFESSKSDQLVVLQQSNAAALKSNMNVRHRTTLQPSLSFKKHEGSRSSKDSYLSTENEVQVIFRSEPHITKRTPSRISASSGNRTFPLTSAEALEQYGNYLTDYEKREIKGYSEIWFVGKNASKIRSDETSGVNHGYDDENGNYNKVINDHLYYRYQVVDVLGKGSFGQVVRAFDHKTKSYVAIKIIRNKKRFYHQAQVELVILNHLRRKDGAGSHNVIHMLDYFYFRRHLCITFELLHMNLYEVIKRNGYHGFNLSVVQKYAFSLVQCLRLLYREKIIHCDLKPENILLQKESGHQIKVIDFGSSCYTYQKVYTYIQSRFYRSPEIILGLPYDRAIDMWSFGCILAELHTGYPLFPGENEVEQLSCIMEVIGLPPYEVLMRATRRKLFFDTKGNPRFTVNSKQRRRKPGSKDLTEALKTDDTPFVDFISRCLQWIPEKRMTADEALKHRWLISLASENTSLNDLRIEDPNYYLSPL